MENLSEKEIIEIINKILMYKKVNGIYASVDIVFEAVQGLLDLYNNLKSIEKEHQKLNGELREELQKEKEKNKFIINENLDDKYEEVLEKTFQKYIDKDFVSKNKIRKKIKEYEETRQKTNDDDEYIAVVNYIDVLEDLLEEE